MQNIVSSIISVTTTNESNNLENQIKDAPNEYRNLLISLSGQKSNHVLWIESWKQFSWKGNKSAEFAFELDRCGVPLLKVMWI